MASTDNNQSSGQAAVKTADYDSYFINMVVLNRSDYGIHARKVWDDIKTNETPAKEAIQNYLTQYRELYSAANRGAEIPAADAAEIRGRLVPQINQLQKIELSIKGIRPTPELIADNFIDTRVRPVEGISEEKIEAVRSAITNYESMEVTPEDAIKTMRDSWESRKIEPKTIDHYTEILKQKIDHYQSDEGGNLDGATASARAAVDIRAQMDRDSGVPARAIVDENHSYYQSDTLTMENWMHGKIYMQKFGDMDDLNGFAYSVHRRNNIEQSMDKAYKKEHPEPEKKSEPETVSPEKETELKTQIEEKETAQNNITTNLLKKHGQELRPMASELNKMGVDLSSGEAMATSLRNTQVLSSVNEAIKQFGGMIPNAIKNTIADFNTIEIERRQLQEQIKTGAPTQQSKTTDGQGIKSDIPTTAEFNGKSRNIATKPEPTPETYNDDAVPVITEDEPQTAATKTTTFNTDFNAV